MQKALHLKATVRPCGKVEFASPELEPGQTVDMVVHLTNNSIERRMGREG